jgi:hypothetical protein
VIWLWIYRAVMTCWIAFIAFILADRFPGFFGNFAVQILCVCGGMTLLFWLLNHRPEKDNGERGDRLADQEWDY